ncbi:MAG: hypothetical protein Q4B43_04320 [Bacteroidota bacterium]|nr:hypothetical protein [Bacteroidota bacterium]
MKNNTLVKQIFWFSIINYIGVFIGVISTLFIYPKNVEFLGIIRIIESYSQIIYPILLVGASQALVHFYPTLSEHYRNKLFWFSILSIFRQTLFFGVIVFFILKIFDIQYEEYIWIALPLALCIALNEVLKKQALNYNKLSVPTLFEKIIPKIGLPLIFIFLSADLIDSSQGTFIFVLFFGAVLLFTYLYTINRTQNKWDKDYSSVFDSISKKEYYKYSIFAFWGSIGSLLAFRIDTLMLSYLGYNLSEIGIYNLAVMMASVLMIPATGIFAIHTPIISESLKKNKLESLNISYKQTANQLLFLGLILYGFILLFVNELFHLLPEKQNLTSSLPILYILGLAVVVNMSTGFNSEIINYSTYYRFNAITIGIMIVLNICLNILFSIYFKMGIQGIAFSTFLSMLLFNLSKTIFIYKRLGLLPFDYNYLKSLLFVSSTIAFTYIISLLSNHLIYTFILIIIYIGLNFYYCYKQKIFQKLNNFINRFLYKYISVVKNRN